MSLSKPHPKSADTMRRYKNGSTIPLSLSSLGDVNVTDSFLFGHPLDFPCCNKIRTVTHAFELLPDLTTSGTLTPEGRPGGTLWNKSDTHLQHSVRSATDTQNPKSVYHSILIYFWTCTLNPALKTKSYVALNYGAF